MRARDIALLVLIYLIWAIIIVGGISILRGSLARGDKDPPRPFPKKERSFEPRTPHEWKEMSDSPYRISCTICSWGKCKNGYKTHHNYRCVASGHGYHVRNEETPCVAD